jgi:hypothetical protein
MIMSSGTAETISALRTGRASGIQQLTSSKPQAKFLQTSLVTRGWLLIGTHR